MNPEEAFELYATKYNLEALKKGLPLYPTDPRRHSAISRFTAPPLNVKGRAAIFQFTARPRYMSPEEMGRFRANFFKDRAETLEPLARVGFRRKQQMREFARRGANEDQENWQAWQAKADEIRTSRTRPVSKRELGKLVAQALGLLGLPEPRPETIRKRIR